MSESCTSHCCKLHGCKYGDDDCPVENGKEEQLYPCEYCDDAGITLSDIKYNVTNETTRKDIAYLYYCIRGSILGGDVDFDKVIEIMTKHGFKIELDELYIVEGE
jgi:hypothetical protein